MLGRLGVLLRRHQYKKHQFLVELLGWQWRFCYSFRRQQVKLQALLLGYRESSATFLHFKHCYWMLLGYRESSATFLHALPFMRVLQGQNFASRRTGLDNWKVYRWKRKMHMEILSGTEQNHACQRQRNSRSMPDWQLPLSCGRPTMIWNIDSRWNTYCIHQSWIFTVCNNTYQELSILVTCRKLNAVKTVLVTN